MRNRPSRWRRGRMAASSIEIAHAMPGRVRLELPRSMLAPERRAGIAAALEAEPGVTGHRFNGAGRSLVVEHGPDLKVRRLIGVVERAPSRRPMSEVKKGRPS